MAGTTWGRYSFVLFVPFLGTYCQEVWWEELLSYESSTIAIISLLLILRLCVHMDHFLCGVNRSCNIPGN